MKMQQNVCSPNVNMFMWMGLKSADNLGPALVCNVENIALPHKVGRFCMSTGATSG